ncbi:hypothetical protein HK097_008655 [Rhizophlyctis rosea]|uniref:Pectate lyase n=1 Tax=Rhizophlyctis rosea TaxID=64517 RepID=A0AAD5SL47_9FUNG|nr:hypothetical protein HK097_008655 [Rhizophlyctis rosea]
MRTTLLASSAVAVMMAKVVHGAAQTSFPSATGTVVSADPISVTGSFDGGMKRYNRPSGYCQGQSEGTDKDTIFLLQDGASLSNVIIGADQGEGVYCLGSCTVTNVWWEDVCEDALSIKGSGTVKVIGGGARGAEDKVFQHNGDATFSVSDFYVENFGKLYRSCGNCSKQYARKSSFSNIIAVKGKVIAGINPNLGDSATFSNIAVNSVKDVCVKYKGVTTGEPSSVGSGPGGGMHPCYFMFDTAGA